MNIDLQFFEIYFCHNIKLEIPESINDEKSVGFVTIVLL